MKDHIMLTYVLLENSKIEPFTPLIYIHGVFSNEVDIWNYIEKEYYKWLNRLDFDILKIVINQYGIIMFFKTDNEECDYIKYEIWKRRLIEG